MEGKRSGKKIIPFGEISLPENQEDPTTQMLRDLEPRPGEDMIDWHHRAASVVCYELLKIALTSNSPKARIEALKELKQTVIPTRQHIDLDARRSPVDQLQGREQLVRYIVGQLTPDDLRLLPQDGLIEALVGQDQDTEPESLEPGE